MASTKKLLKFQAQTSVLPLEQDAVVPSILPTGISSEEALVVAIKVIECISYEIMSRESLYLAVLQARNQLDKKYWPLLERILVAADCKRQTNIISGMF